MTPTKRTKLKNYDAGPTQTLEQQDEAEAASMPLEITARNSRPRLSGEGAEAALQHLIERETPDRRAQAALNPDRDAHQSLAGSIAARLRSNIMSFDSALCEPAPDC